MTVYIPTRSRQANLAKIVPRWLDQDVLVRLVVDQEQFRDHVGFRDRMGWRRDVEVIPISRAHLPGIGSARRLCVNHARHDGLTAIIMSDDDMKPVGDCRPLLAAADQPGVLGIGATRGIHDYFTGGAVSRNHGIILCPGGWGFQLFGLNIETAVRAGNFNDTLHSYGEDGELCRRGIARGIPWLVHCDVKCAPIGARYAPGGIGSRFRSPEARTEAERECLTRIYKRWPKYTNHPDKPLRVAWQKMLDAYIPDWRERSAIHGGKLAWNGLPAAQSQPESASRR